MKLLRQSLNILGKIALVVAIAAVSLVMFSPNIIARYLQGYANRVYLNPIGYRLSYQNFKGDFLGTMNFSEVSIRSMDGRVAIVALNADLNIDIIRLLPRDLAFDEISIDTLIVEVPTGTGDRLERIPIEKLPWLSVRHLLIKRGTISTADGDLTFRLEGQLELRDRATLDEASIELAHPSLADTVGLKATRLEFDGATLTVTDGEARHGGSRIVLAGSIDLLPELAFDLRAAATTLDPIKLLPDWLAVNGFLGRIRGTPERVELQLSLDATTQGKTFDRAEIRLVVRPAAIDLTRLNLVLNGQQITASGNLKSEGESRIEARLSAADPAEFIPGAAKMILDGRVTAIFPSGVNNWESISVALDLNRLQYQGKQVSRIRGRIARNGNIWSITDTVSARLPGGDVQLWGNIDAAERALDIEVYLHADSLAMLLAMFDLPEVSGRADGQMWISGSELSPSLTGALLLSNTSFAGLSADQSFVQFVLQDVRSHPNGRLLASLGDLDLFGLPAEGIELELFLSGDTLRANYLRIYQGVERLATKGFARLVHPYELVLDTLTVTRNTEPLAAGPLTLRETADGSFAISNRIEVAGGTIGLSGTWDSQADFDIDLSVENIDLERLYRFLGQPAAYRGIVVADGKIANHGNRLDVSGEFQASNGTSGEIPFSRVESVFDIHGGTLTLHNLDWTGLEGSWAAKGSFIYADDPDRFGSLGAVTAINLQGSLDHYQFHELQSALPWSMQTYGLMSGTFQVTGSPEAPHYVADLRATAPRFDRITGRWLSGHLDYQDELLTFKNLELRTARGHYTGGGYLPADLSPTAEKLDVIRDRPVNLLFKGAASELEFLPPYFDEIDSLQGDYRMELALSGSFGRLIRDGWVGVQDGRAELFMMENPITSITGRAVIEANQLRVLNMTGKTPKPSTTGVIGQVGAFFSRIGGQANRDESHIEVSGTMDMTEFFHPGFNLQITGSKVYFATPLREIEAVGNASFSVVGKDTIHINGQFIPDPGALVFAAEIIGPRSYNVPEPDGGVLILHNINIPFYGGALVKNSEVDAEVEGEITLTATGSEDFRFAGNVELVQGTFDYNGYSFDIIEGSVLLDPSEFNPQFYIRAVTEVELPARTDFNSAGSPELELTEITLTMSGKLDEPNLLLESNSTAYTQSDLLQLLALGDASLAIPDAVVTAGRSVSNLILRELQRDARKTVGLDRLRILTGGSRTTLPGQSGIRVSLGKRLSPRLYVGIQADPTLSFNQYQYRVAYRLNRTMSLEGSLDPNGLYQINYRIKYRY